MNSDKKACYSLIQEIVAARDKVCKGLGCSEPVVVAHHTFPRNRMATAFDPKWLVGFCNSCHRWSHEKPAEFEEWAKWFYGYDEYYEGLRRSHTVVKGMDFAAVRAGRYIVRQRGGWHSRSNNGKRMARV